MREISYCRKRCLWICWLVNSKLPLASKSFPVLSRGLSLARSSDASWSCAGGSSITICMAIVLLWVDLAVCKGRDIRDLRIDQGTGGLSSCWALAVLLVGGDVERDEEDEVRAKDSHARESSEFLSSTATRVWHPWKVGGGEVCVRGKVNKDKVNHELNDLETSNPFLPPDANATRALEVVPVHDNVNHQVKSNWDPGHRSQANQLGVAEKGSRAMMVAVEESQWLLLQD